VVPSRVEGQRGTYAEPKGQHELFDLIKDPGETRNVYADPANAGVVKELKERLRKHMAEVGDQAVSGDSMG
jgi:hypothetical protein